MDIGQGEVNWDELFSSLAAVRFDGIVTSCVFAWEERADESGRFMRKEIGDMRTAKFAQGPVIVADDLKHPEQWRGPREVFGDLPCAGLIRSTRRA
jgi:hypothetical protein